MKKSVVIDTNVLVAATRSRIGGAFVLMTHVRSGRIVTRCSAAMFLEYEAVFKRPEQRAASGLLLSDVDEVLYELAALVVPVRTHYQWRPQLRDPADEMVLEAAVNASADAMVSYNLKDFDAAFKFGLKILTPQQTMAFLG